MAYNGPLTTPKTRKPPPITAVYPETGLPQKKREPNKFLKIINGIAGGPFHAAADIGSLVGNLIGGTSSSALGSYGALYEQRRFREFSTVSNLMKTRHDSEMTEITNIRF